MGLSSSQARLLVLTARKSDLEYRAQVISQRKINLALQTEQLANTYSDSLANREMLLCYANKDGEEQYTELSYDAIMSDKNEAFIGDFTVKTSSGKYAVANPDDAFDVACKLAKLEDPNFDKSKIKSPEEANNLISKYKGQMQIVEELHDPKYFQDALRNGGLFLSKKEDNDNEYKTVAWSSCGVIHDVYDESDDAKAEAEYESQTAILSNQDKMLDLELNQIETQHSAVKTEIDSVQKLVDNNIEKTFKSFA